MKGRSDSAISVPCFFIISQTVELHIRPVKERHGNILRSIFNLDVC